MWMDSSSQSRPWNWVICAVMYYKKDLFGLIQSRLRSPFLLLQSSWFKLKWLLVPLFKFHIFTMIRGMKAAQVIAQGNISSSIAAQYQHLSPAQSSISTTAQLSSNPAAAKPSPAQPSSSSSSTAQPSSSSTAQLQQPSLAAVAAQHRPITA